MQIIPKSIIIIPWTITRLLPIKTQEVMMLNKPCIVWGHKVYIGATRTTACHYHQ
ncbi:hypothetical protein [Candidatus Albibeggiatoa sp. nov. BB20]|uniref:hypothetical protein n=1 Tax=Candidatus Albibeggiatoa sp. nov. BB20 TaxID=3162723 RepID=UPI0033654A87